MKLNTFYQINSVKTVLIYTPTINVWKDLFPHSLTNTVYYLTLSYTNLNNSTGENGITVLFYIYIMSELSIFICLGTVCVSFSMNYIFIAFTLIWYISK